MKPGTRLLLVLLALLLCLASLSGPDGGGGGAAPVPSVEPLPEPAPAREGLTLSVLGDSISTFDGLSGGAAADTTNSTIRFNDVYYRSGLYGMAPSDTWWQQTADALGLRLLVNNSWSGSCIYSPYFPEACGWGDRCVNLHDDTGEDAGREPDIIAVYLGTNDLLGSPDTLGRPEDIDFDALIAPQGDGTFSYGEPATTAEACAVMLHRITHRYPDAQVYFFTIPSLLDEQEDPEPINRTIRTLAARYGAVVVDLYADSGITAGRRGRFLYYGDAQIHPSPRGMDAIANCFTAALLQNCPGLPFEGCAAAYDLDGVFLDSGTPVAVVKGAAFEAGIVTLNGGEAEVTVTMGGDDITDTCLLDGRIRIPEVTGDLFIRAREV